jgi:hypothetical protein
MRDTSQERNTAALRVARLIPRPFCAFFLKGELQQIATNDDLHISLFREDGVMYGTPIRIWSVAVRPELLCGPTTERSLVGIRARHIDDDAYREKYKGSPCLSSMIGARARAATLKAVPC